MQSENKDGAGASPAGVAERKPDNRKPPAVGRELLKGCFHLFWTWIGFDALAEDFETHENVVRKAKVLRFLLVVSLLVFVSGYILKGCIDSTKIAELEQDKHKQEITIQDVKADFNRVTTEKIGLQGKLDMRQTWDLQSPIFPTNFSYFIATQSTNQQQLSQLSHTLEGITNSLADAALMPTFDLYINKTKITNGTILSLKHSRILNLKVQNTSPITAEQLKVLFQAPYGLDPTNLLSARGWIQLPDDAMKSDDPTIPEFLSCHGWRWNADTIIEGNGPCPVDSLEISTNFTYPRIKVKASVYAVRSKVRSYDFLLSFD